jgi:hypothetical protein
MTLSIKDRRSSFDKVLEFARIDHFLYTESETLSEFVNRFPIQLANH